MRNLSPNVLRDIREMLCADYLALQDQFGKSSWTRAIDAIDAASKPRRSVKLAKARKAVKRQTRKEKVAAIRAEVLERSNGLCEARCGRFGTELDHFHGGRNRRSCESVGGCWLLCARCHLRKTRNEPSAGAWLEEFIEHALRHAYTKAASMARARLASLEIQGRT